MNTIEPSANIYRAGKQYYDAAVLVIENQNDGLSNYIYPVLVNLSLSCELVLKSIECTVDVPVIPDRALLPQAEVASKSWGHKLSKIYEALSETNRTKLASAFEAECGEKLTPLLDKCDEYFVKARYPWESDSRIPFSVTGVKNLAEGLIKIVPNL